MKYYVTFGDHQEIFQAGNQYQACIKMLVKRLQPACCLTDEIYIGGRFRISNRGHDEHDDDTYIDMSEIMSILLVANGTLRRKKKKKE